MQLTGALRELRYPNLCAACGAEAKSFLTIRKVFPHKRRQRREGFRIDGAKVPFCGACIARHEAEVKRVTPLTRVLYSFRSFLMIPVIGCGVMAFLIGSQALAELRRGSGNSAYLLGSVTAGFAALGLFFYVRCWLETARYGVEAQTSVTKAFDFSADLSEMFEGERRHYVLANETFANAFFGANANRRWYPGGKKARRAERKRTMLAILLAVALAIAAFVSWWFGD